jgi:pimeloyl-ACP methyl ester carboxylesterase
VTDFLFAGPRGPIAGSVTGEGPCVVLVSGLGATRRLWGELPQILGRQFTAITLDNPGVGQSRGGERFTFDGAADDLVEAVQRLSHERCSLLGASLGGVIVVRAALRHPEAISRLVVASSAARLTGHGTRMLGMLRRLLQHLPAEEFGSSLMSLAFAPPFHERMPGFVKEAAGLYGLDPEDVPGAIAQAEHMLEGWDDRPRLRELGTPALVLSGRRDPIVATEDTAEIAEVMPNASLITLPDAAHSVLAEGDAELLERVIAFLGPDR